MGNGIRGTGRPLLRAGVFFTPALMLFTYPLIALDFMAQGDNKNTYQPFALSLSKRERRRSSFDRLRTNGYIYFINLKFKCIRYGLKFPVILQKERRLRRGDTRNDRFET
jgi:hypothetical protein